MIKHTLAAAAAVLFTLSASAQTSINLANYQLTGNYALDTLGDRGLEASAVTYARDRNSLFFVGDEGLGVVEISRTGQTLGSMAFNWAGTGSSNNDAEGLTYLGGGRLVVVDERPQAAYRFDYVANGTVALASTPKVWLGASGTPFASVGNVGTEGLSYDARDGRFFSVKQDNPTELRVGSAVTFAVGGGSATTSVLFSGAASVFGLNSLSDIQTLDGVDALTGTAAADNLLVLSLDSKKLVEINRSTGAVLSSFNLAGVTNQAIEGVTIDQNGVIFLVAEDSGTANSRMFVLTPVPEPETWGLMLAGVALLGAVARRRNKVAP